MDSALHCKVDSALSAIHVGFPPDSPNVTPDEVVGGYLGGKLCWLAKGASLKIVNHGSKHAVCSHIFSHYNEDLFVKVTSCKRYDSNTLIVGLRTEEERGIVCIFSLFKNKILKSIELPYPVTCLEVVLHEGGVNRRSKAFAQNLRWLFGVVAVGTEGGHLYLLDLRLDDKIVTFENEPAKIEAIPTVVHDVPYIRDTVHKRSGHIAFELLDSCFENNDFHYTAPDDQIIETIDCSDVSITALQFEHRTLSLLVGYSFGQFQIFDLTDLTLSFSSIHDDLNTEVVNFAFQEPENDPRNCCYLWVVRSPNDTDAVNNVPLTATMHQLVYQKKEIIEQDKTLRSFYQRLENCSTQYDLILDSSLGLSPEPGKSTLFQCSTIESYPPPHQFNEDESEYCSTPFTSLFIIGWQSYSDISRSTQVLVFDINSWYNAHMPTCYRGFGEDLTYIAIWEMDSVLTQKASTNLLAFSTPENSLRHFKTKVQPMPEQFLRPSAFSVVTYVLTKDETISLQMHGIQRQVILFLMEERSACLVEPSDILEQMVEVGLIEDIGLSSLTLQRKREKILTAALDHNLFGFMSRVIVDLATGEFASSGCTSRFVMEWAWKTVAIIKDSFDTLCVPIFDCSTFTLDPTVHNDLCKYQRHLEDLLHIFKALLREANVSSEESVAEIEMKQNVVQLILGYIKVLRWFIEARLLPEQLEGHICPELPEHLEFHYVYDQKMLQTIFERRRRELNATKKYGDGTMLIIDGIVNDAGAALKDNWKKMSDTKSDLYPPPSIMALLDMYYLDSVDIEVKNMIVTYFLLDVLTMGEMSEDELDNIDIDSYRQSRAYHRDMVSFFPITFQLSNSVTNLIKAFWLLDHKEFEESLALFSDAGTETPQLPWQHRQILSAYMSQGHCELALKYLLNKQPGSQSVEDVKLKIEIYTQNKLPQHALKIAQTNTDPCNLEMIYFHLFSCCYKNKLLNSILSLPVSLSEDSLLARYFESGNIPNSQNLLVLYHLKNSRYTEAIRAYQQNKHSNLMIERDDAAKSHNETLKHVIQGYLNILPEVEREIACSSNKAFERNKQMRKEVLKAKPLSATLNSHSSKVPLSHAALFAMSYHKDKEVQHKPSETPFRKKSSKVSETLLNKSSKIIFPEDITDSTTVKTPTRKSFSRRSRSSFGGEADSPLFRRYSRLSSAQVTSPVFDVSRKSKRQSSSNEMAMLLQTPPITRKLPRSASREQPFEMMTPQSILKVKLLKAKSPSLPSIPQHSITSSNLTQVESGSLTSLSRVSQECNVSTTRDLLFAVPTPNVDRQSFKGIRMPESKANETLPFTPKRLRFFGVMTSPNKEAEGSESQPKPLPVSNDNIVVMRLANEDIDVDVTGDVTDDVTAISSDDLSTIHEEISPVVPCANDDVKVKTSPCHVNVTSDPGEVPGTSANKQVPFESEEHLDTASPGEIADKPVVLETGDEFSLQMSGSEEENEEKLGEGGEVVEEQEEMEDQLQEEKEAELVQDVVMSEVDENLQEDFAAASPQSADEFVLQLSDSGGEANSAENEDQSEDIVSPQVDMPEVLFESDNVNEHKTAAEESPGINLEEPCKTEVLGEIELKVDSSDSGSVSSPTPLSSVEDSHSMKVVGSQEEPVSEFMNEVEKWDELLSSKTETDAKPKDDFEDKMEASLPKDEVSNAEQQSEIAPKTPPKSIVKQPKVESRFSTNLAQTPTTNRLTSEPVYVLSPPTTRAHRTKASLIKDEPGTPEPQFILSPATTRTRSVRKHQTTTIVKEPASAKKSRLTSPPRDMGDVTSKPPVPASAKKSRKSTSRKLPLTPSRTSARVKARSIDVDNTQPTEIQTQSLKSEQLEHQKDEITVEQEEHIDPPTTTRTSSRSRRARTPSRQDQPDVTPVLRSTRKAQIRAQSEETHDLRKTQSQIDTELTKTATKTPSKRRKIVNVDDSSKATANEGKSNEQPSTVVHISPRRRTRLSEAQQTGTTTESEADVPVVHKTGSKSRSKRKTIITISDDTEDADAPQPPTVTRAGSKSRTQRKGKHSEEDVTIVSEDPTAPPTVTKTASKKQSKLKIQQEATEDEAAPVVTRTSSRRSKVQKQEEPPTVTRTSSRRKGAASSSDVPESSDVVSEEAPTVTKTSSRRRKTTAPAVAEEEPPHVPRSSSRRTRNQASESEIEEHPPTVTRTSSRRRKTQISNAAVDSEPPVVKKTSSKGHRSKTASKASAQEDDVPVVTRTSSRNRGKSGSNDQVVTTRTSSSRHVHIKISETGENEELPDIVEIDSSVQDEEDIVLVEMPEKGNTPSGNVTAKTSRTEARPSVASFPIVARRRAKVFTWKKTT
uniref:Protein ELYS-like n=1 Tax=Phallusia mammillata TaxID=59560 RepID=A0A6F9D699_9ASCI|nr:protein ELYS-like [Phallusia mammillata]